MLKKKILVFNKFYLPGFKAGGPIRTIANLIERLGDEFDFNVVTSDRDAGVSKQYKDICVEDWNDIGKGRVRYVVPGTVRLALLDKLIKEVEPSAIYLNSFFDSLFTQRVLLLRKLGRISGIPIIIAPRGEFSLGAMTIKRPKKLVFLFLARFIGLYKNVTWQASSELEKKDIQKVFPNIKDVQIHVAINLAPAIDASCLRAKNFRADGDLRVVFLGRISPMKNLDYALRVLTNVKSSVEFTIYGPKEVATYWDECQALINALPKNVQVSWKGEVAHDCVPELLAGHDIFFFPTRGENYGHVIHEALCSGLPVLISDQTPWQDLEMLGVGWSLPLGAPERFARQIDEVASWSSERLNKVSRAAFEYGVEKSVDTAALDANRQLFLKAIKVQD